MDVLIPCLILLVAVFLLLAPILAILAIVRVTKLREELERLQLQLDSMRERSWVDHAAQRKEPPVPEYPKETEDRGPSKPTEPRPAEAKLVESDLTRAEIKIPPRTFEFPTEIETAKEIGIEEKLGSRLFVWIGAVAMALAGAFLVKYSFDKNILTPKVRIILGLVFGLALLLVAEWMRKRSRRIAQGLAAAGVAILFSSLYAAVNLYDLISPTLGFFLMAVVTALAVALSLRQGPFVALLGLVGGFLTPVLVRTGEQNPSIFAYFFMLEIGLLAVTRRQGWQLLAGLTLIGGMGWAAVWLLMFYETTHSLWIGPYLLATVAVFNFSARAGRAEETWGDAVTRSALTWASTLSGLLLVSLLVGVGDFSSLEWAFLGLLGAGCLVLGRIDQKLEGLAWLASAAGIALLVGWYFNDDEIAQHAYGLTILAFGLLFAGGGYACLWGTQRTVYWAALSVISAIGYLLVGYYCLDELPWRLSWGMVCLILAALYIVGIIPVALRRIRARHWEESLAALAVGVTALISLAVPIELERAWIAVAWALEVPALALIDRRFRVGMLQILAGILATLVCSRLLLNPEVLEYPIGMHPLWNWLLYGYGLPAISLAAGAWLFKGWRDERLVDGLGGGAIALGFALITLLIRQFYHPAELDYDLGLSGLNEWATFSIAWFAFGLTLMIACERWPQPCIAWGSRIIAAIAALEIILLPCLIENPLWNHHPVGSQRILNYLLFIYGLPAILALPVTWELVRQKQRQLARVFGSVALLLFFTLISLQVRQFFQGDFLDAGSATNAEWYTYSVAWILFGAILLILGITTRGVVLRYASLVVMFLAVGKVFLSDTAHLRDLYRVFSLFGLGVSLLLLAYLYQRFVFRKTD